MDQNMYLVKGQEILRRLNELGYEAYFVGGVVRDHLLKIPFNDIDITTSATPDQVIEIFPNAKQEFAQLGTVTIIIEDMEYEITTFRTEEYTGVRKPSNVHYSKKLREDILRRDFTINALAMSPNGKIYDLCDGTKDLESHIIRAIGNPKVRFKEDPLRILRAFRLISKLDFSIESKTVSGLLQTKKELSKLTEAKVIEEMTKIFQGQYANSALKQMVNAGIAPYLPLDKRAIKVLSSTIKKLSVEEAFAICYKLAGAVSEKANFSQNTVKRLQQIIDLSKLIENDPVTDVIVFKYGADIALSANKVNRVINGFHYKDQEKLIKKIEATQPIAKPSELAFKGQDLLILTNGKQGPFFTDILDELRTKVVTKELPNDFYKLREQAIKLLDTYKFDLKPEPAKVNNMPKENPFTTPSPVKNTSAYTQTLLQDDDDPVDEEEYYRNINRELENRYKNNKTEVENRNQSNEYVGTPKPVNNSYTPEPVATETYRSETYRSVNANPDIRPIENGYQNPQNNPDQNYRTNPVNNNYNNQNNEYYNNKPNYDSGNNNQAKPNYDMGYNNMGYNYNRPNYINDVNNSNVNREMDNNTIEKDLARKEEEIRIQWQILMKERFKLDFEKMVQANIANLPNANALTPEQKANLASQMGPSIRQMLININIDYQKLAKEGII